MLMYTSHSLSSGSIFTFTDLEYHKKNYVILKIQQWVKIRLDPEYLRKWLLKHANKKTAATPVFKARDQAHLTNYRPLSVLEFLLKIS